MEHTHLVKGLDYALLQKVGQVNWSKGTSLAPCLSICLSVCLSAIHLSVLIISVWLLFVYLSFCSSVYLSVCLRCAVRSSYTKGRSRRYTCRRRGLRGREQRWSLRRTSASRQRWVCTIGVLRPCVCLLAVLAHQF